MDEPEGAEGPSEAAQASPLPEGAIVDEKAAADPAQREGVPPLRAERQSAAHLDILVEMDEPEALMERLRRVAGERTTDQRWATVFHGAREIELRLEALNRPASHR